MKKKSIPVFLFICSAMLTIGFATLLACILTGCDGEKQKSAEMNIDIIDGKIIRNGTEVYTYQVEDGQKGILSIRIDRESGRLDLDIYPTGSEEKPEYTGRSLESTSFDVNLKNAGEYKVLFTADKFIGEYGIEWKTEKETD